VGASSCGTIAASIALHNVALHRLVDTDDTDDTRGTDATSGHERCAIAFVVQGSRVGVHTRWVSYS
jgi:hypothetical protein